MTMNIRPGIGRDGCLPLKVRRRRQDLRRYQRIFVNKIKRLPELILALPMGSGKTGTTLTAILDLLDDGEVNRVLILAPKNVAAATWPDEIEEWEHTSLLEWTVLRVEDDDPAVLNARRETYRAARDLIGLDVKEATRLAGGRASRVKALKRAMLADSDTEIHIINKEAFPWLWNHFGCGKRWPYDMMVVDEASMYKNAKMRTGKKSLSRFGAAVKARKHLKRVVLLAGTPTPKGVQNLWGLAKVADGGERLGDTRRAFENRWFNKDYMGWNLEPKPGAVQDIMNRMSDIMFSLDESDCVELPPCINVPVKVTLPSKVMNEYRRFERRLVSEMYDVVAVNRGVLSGKLLQFANGSMYDEDGRDVWIHDEKLAALEAIVDEANYDPVLVAYSFKFDLARIRKAFKKAVVWGESDIRRTKAAWNAGDIPLMLAHPNSIGHGQNIQDGGRISVWYGLTPDLELYQQFNKRLHRSGQQRTVFNHHIIAAGTYDEDILPILESRESDQNVVIQSVKVRLIK